MLNSQQKSFVDAAIEKFGTDTVTKKQLLELQQEFGVGKYFGQEFVQRVGRGLYTNYQFLNKTLQLQLLKLKSLKIHKFKAL